MNTLLKIPLLVALGMVATARLSAGVESFKIEPTVDPQYSASMQMDGVTEGSVVWFSDTPIPAWCDPAWKR
jgi:hypothetical protein